MTDIPLYGGPLKRDLIKGAYGVCGQSDTDFELTTEEYDSACRVMNQLLARWQTQYGIVLGYNFPATGNGSADEESGIPDDAAEAVTQALARRIAPGIGKAFGAEANTNLAEAMAALRSHYATVPLMGLGRNTPRGAGNRRFIGSRNPYFVADISPDEVVQ